MALRILWDPLPDDHPTSAHTHLRGVRRLAASIMDTRARLSLADLIEGRVHRGQVQALVRHTYTATLAEQEEARRKPREFANVWRARLEDVLSRARIQVNGWGEIELATVDVAFAWELFELASRARLQTLDRAQAGPSRSEPSGDPPALAFKVAITGDDDELGVVHFGVCPECGVGLLRKISISPDWQYCGLGSMTLRELERRHPDLIWHTTGQYSWARGFYARIREGSSNPWTMCQHPCPHFP